MVDEIVRLSHFWSLGCVESEAARYLKTGEWEVEKPLYTNWFFGYAIKLRRVPHVNPEPRMGNWDQVREAVARGDYAALAEHEPHAPRDRSRP